MVKPSEALLQMVNTFTTSHQYSETVHWLGLSDFSSCVYVSPSYEKVWGYNRKTLFKDISVWETYLFPKDLADHHPLIEMVKRIKLYGPEARYNEMYRIVDPNGEIKYIEDRGHPVYNSEGRCIAITGVAIDVTSKKLIDQLSIKLPNKFLESNQRRFYLKRPYQGIYLTSGEAKCAFYLLQCKTAKETAKILNLSPRAIEHTIERIKDKFGVKYKSELFDALINSRFIESLECL